LAQCCGAHGKLVVYYHMDAIGSGWLRPFISLHSRLMMPRIIRSADRVLVTTMDYAEKGNLSRLVETRPGLFRELKLTVDIDRFAPGPRDAGLSSRLGLSSSDRVVLFVGGLDRAHYFKGLSKLLLAMTVPELERARLIVVGSGDLMPQYEAEAERLGLRGRAVFAGKVADGELPDYYRLADVLAFPSTDKSEAFGIAALEALSSGVPVVASDLAGVRTIVRDGETGLRVPAGSASALALAVSRLLEDDELRRKTGESARQMVVREYSDSARMEGWSLVLEELFPDWGHFSQSQQ
jgi:glycosyltransferase involved in cell wall biosynthesis